MKYQRVTVRQLLICIGISHESVMKILHSELGMTKVSAQWVPRLDALHAAKLPSSSISALFAGLSSIRFSPFSPYDKSIGWAAF